MKECRYCGSGCDDNARLCPNCGGNRFYSEEEIAEEKAVRQEEKRKRDEYEHTRKSGILRLAAIAAGIVAVLVVVVALLTNDGGGKVSASTGMDKDEIKTAYETAIAYMEQGDYANAITYFSMIQGYKDTARMLEKAKDGYKAKVKPEILSTAQGYINSNEYGKAIATLQGAESILPGDLDIAVLLKSALTSEIKFRVWTFDSDSSKHTTDGYAEMIGYFEQNGTVVSADVELSVKQSELINAFRNLVLEKAETALNETGYEDSIAILNQGLSVLKGDDILITMVEKNKTYAPISLASLDYYQKNKDFEFQNDVKDNLGNVYAIGIYTYPNKFFDNPTITYRLEKKFSRFEAFYINNYEERDAKDFYRFALDIYCDGQLAFHADSGAGIDPIRVEVDLSGVDEFTIEIYQNGRSWGGEASDLTFIADPVLYLNH